MSSAVSVRPARLSATDTVRVGASGLAARPLRSLLSALGIAIGIAAVTSVLGISASSQAALIAQLDSLGTNLLQVQAGQTFGGSSSSLPLTAEPMISRIAPVQVESSVATVSTNAYRTHYIPAGETNGIQVKAAKTNLLKALAGTMSEGSFITAATENYPVVVLGSLAAERLGFDHWIPNATIDIGGQQYLVAGIMNSMPLAPDIDRSALMGYPQAMSAFGMSAAPTTVYVRSTPDQIDAVGSVLPATVNPANPNEVTVSQPSDALSARIAANDAFNSLFLGLGAVALLVGGVGIANVMVISVLERRSEIGLRRALGATKGNIRNQFLTESLLLAGAGGVAGVALGIVITLIYATTRNVQLVVPVSAVAGGIAISLLLGAIAGLYPAIRAARLSPTDALRSV
jgi:putative ABC transport system permease protein